MRRWTNEQIAKQLRESARWLAIHGMLTDTERGKVLRRINKVYGRLVAPRAGVGTGSEESRE